MSEKDEFRIPEGIREYAKLSEDIDLKLLPGEEIYKIIRMHPLSKIREFILSALIAFYGYMLYLFFNSKITLISFINIVIMFLLIYFIWHYKITLTLKKLVWDLIKYVLYIILLGYFITFLTTYLSPIVTAIFKLLGLPSTITSSLPNFTLNPIENIKGIIIFVFDLVKTYLIKYTSIFSLASIGLIIAALIAIPCIYFYSRGRLYYITNKRVIIKHKYGTIQVTTLPIDGIVEVTAFQSLAGRIFGFGDVIIAMVSGGGVEKSLAPSSISLSSGLYSIKRKLEVLRIHGRLRT